jgi:hypothetical protein
VNQNKNPSVKNVGIEREKKVLFFRWEDVRGE